MSDRSGPRLRVSDAELLLRAVTAERVLGDAERLLRAAEKALTFYANPRNWRDDDWGVRAVLRSSGYGNPTNHAAPVRDRIRRFLEAPR